MCKGGQAMSLFQKQTGDIVELTQAGVDEIGKYKNKYTSLCIIMQEDFSIFLKEFTLFIDSLVLLKYPAFLFLAYSKNVPCI